VRQLRIARAKRRIKDGLNRGPDGHASARIGSSKGTHFIGVRAYYVALAAFHVSLIPLSRFWNPVAAAVLLASRLPASFGSLAGRCVSCCGRECDTGFGQRCAFRRRTSCVTPATSIQNGVM